MTPFKPNLPLTLPTPQEVEAARTSVKMTKTEFGRLLHTTRRTVLNWETPKDSPAHRQMSLATWELALAKLGMLELDVIGRPSGLETRPRKGVRKAARKAAARTAGPAPAPVASAPPAQAGGGLPSHIQDAINRRRELAGKGKR